MSKYDETSPSAVLSKVLKSDGSVAYILDTNGFPIVNLLGLTTSDQINVAMMSKGNVTLAHNAISATATSSEIPTVGYNAVLIHVVISGTGTWNVKVQNSPTSGGTFVDAYDGSTQLSTGDITASRCVLFRGITDYIRIVATEVADGATCTVRVIPVVAT